MSASFPSSVKSFTTKLAGDTIQPAHLNDVQAEITAIETALVGGTLPAANGSALTNLTAANIVGTLNASTVGGYTPAQLMALIMPVGFVVTLGVSTNPNTLYGFGTWTAIAGKVIVGLDSGQTEFDTLDETGGAKTVTLDTTMIPSHTHAQFVSAGGGAATAVSRATDRLLSTTATTAEVTGATGGGAAHANLQPYIVKYVWQRTA